MSSRKDDIAWKLAKALTEALRAAGLKTAGIYLELHQYGAGRPDERVVRFRVYRGNGTSHINVAEDGTFRILTSSDDRLDSRVLTRQVHDVLSKTDFREQLRYTR